MLERIIFIRCEYHHDGRVVSYWRCWLHCPTCRERFTEDFPGDNARDVADRVQERQCRACDPSDTN
jgi:hypothetical protein